MSCFDAPCLHSCAGVTAGKPFHRPPFTIFLLFSLLSHHPPHSGIAECTADEMDGARDDCSHLRASVVKLNVTLATIQRP
jgi:hypothetical protein